jgi:hypothetical protein
LLYKAKTNRRSRDLVLPEHLNVSLQFAEKGSYRTEHILRYLSRWLEEWTPERARLRAWRVLYMDVAKSHLADEITQYAHDRGYCVLLHYGCTTGVAQINDTDLHCELEAQYLELEQCSFHSQQLWDPGNISRTLQQVLDDLGGSWRSVDHTRGARGHKKVGLNNALDGSEDHLITREARLFWLEADMATLRSKAIAEVDALVDSGEVADFSEWRQVIAHPEDPGVVEDEGAEFEGHFDDDECVWDDDVAGSRAADDHDVEQMDEASSSVVVEAMPGDAPADVADAVVAAKRLQSLKRLRAAAVTGNVPAAAFQVDREVNQLERGLRAGGRKEDAEVNVVLRRHMDKVCQDEWALIKRKQAEAFQRRNNLAKVKLSLAKARAVKAQAAEDKKALKEQLDKLPQKFTIVMFSQKGAKGKKARCDALERIKLRAPKLSPVREEQWADVRDAYVGRTPVRFKIKDGDKAWAVDFAKQLDKLLRDLGTWYQGPSLYSKPGTKGGSESAFVQFFQLMVRNTPALIGEVVC